MSKPGQDTELYHNMAFAEKGDYLSFIYDLGEKGLKRLFAFPGEDFSLWWFSRLVEKPTIKSDSYKRLISFLAFGGGRPKGRLREALLVQFLSGLYTVMVCAARTLCVKGSMKDFRLRAQMLRRHDYNIVSYFPLINEEAAKRGVFENLYLGPFHRVLEERRADRYGHILFQTGINGRGLRDSIGLARKFAKKQSVFFLEEFARPADTAWLLIYYLYFSAVFILNIGRIKRMVRYEHKGASHDVWGIFRNDFYTSFCGPNLASSVWYIVLFRRMAGYLKKESKILCICEMQWWEKALYAYARRRGITTVGLQHTIVPELLLNYFNDPREMTGLDFLKYCPLPDYLATVGRISSEMFRRGGWPSQRVFVWGSPRFESLKAVTESPVPWADKGNYFVAAFSVNIEEIEKFLCLLKDAFSQARGYKVMIKSHPAEDLKSHVRRMGLELDPSVFEFTSEPLGKIIRKAKGFIGTISSSCLYALACDIPVMVPRFAGLIDCSPLSYISDIPLYIYTPDQLRSACEDILRSAEPPCSGGKNRRFLEDYLYFPKDEGEYLEKIESI